MYPQNETDIRLNILTSGGMFAARLQFAKVPPKGYGYGILGVEVLLKYPILVWRVLRGILLVCFYDIWVWDNVS